MSDWYFAGYTRRGRAKPAPGDIYWGNVVLLARFNGADGDVIYTAETGQVFTIAGASKISNTQAKFGGTSWACVNTTTGSFPASSTWDLSPTANGDQFTVEWQQYVPHNFVDSISCLQTGYNTDGFLMRCGDAATMSYYWIDNASGNDSLTQASAGFIANQWQAICYEKNSSGVINFYIDGTRVKTSAPANSTIKVSSFPLLVGPALPGQTCYMDELRITKGVARYNASSYSVQTEQFPIGP